jgi:hypothetical protein
MGLKDQGTRRSRMRASKAGALLGARRQLLVHAKFASTSSPFDVMVRDAMI